MFVKWFQTLRQWNLFFWIKQQIKPEMKKQKKKKREERLWIKKIILIKPINKQHKVSHPLSLVSIRIPILSLCTVWMPSWRSPWASGRRWSAAAHTHTPPVVAADGRQGKGTVVCREEPFFTSSYSEKIKKWSKHWRIVLRILIP